MKRILTAWVCDYFHLGHLRLFKQAKMYGNCLIVAVQDGDYILKYKPNSDIKYTTSERIELIEALKCVDKVDVYKNVDEYVFDNIDNFDVFAVGED